MIPKIKNCTCNYQELVKLGFPTEAVIHSRTCGGKTIGRKDKTTHNSLEEIFDIMTEI